MSADDVVVVGGGVVGTSLAYEAVCRGASVTLVDAHHGGRASDAGAGIVSPETLSHPHPGMFEFGSAAAAHMREVITRMTSDGNDLDESTFAECGSLVLALAEHEEPWFTEVAELVTARSNYVVEVSPETARSMFPPLGDVWRAIHNPRAARVDGRMLTSGLLDSARRLGLTVVEERAVAFDTTGDKVTAVRTEHDVITCGAVALAGGAWSQELSEQLRMKLPVSPTKGQIVHVVSSADESVSTGWPIVQPILDFYLVPWPAGRVACGGTFEPDAGFDVRPTASGIRDLLRELVKIAPGLGDATFVDVRVGFRPTSVDDLPILGPLPEWSNVHVCTGHGANGLMLGPYSGSLVAAAILDPVALLPEQFSPLRFVS